MINEQARVVAKGVCYIDRSKWLSCRVKYLLFLELVEEQIFNNKEHGARLLCVIEFLDKFEGNKWC